MTIPEEKRLGTINEVKQALGEEARQLLRQIDGSRKERNDTREAAKKLSRFQKVRRCWACGRREGGPMKVWRAHVFPIEEGGHTAPEGLIPLCVRTKRKLPTGGINEIMPRVGVIRD